MEATEEKRHLRILRGASRADDIEVYIGPFEYIYLNQGGQLLAIQGHQVESLLDALLNVRTLHNKEKQEWQ